MISDTDVCKHCHRIVGEVPKYHCPRSPTGMHEPVETPEEDADIHEGQPPYDEDLPVTQTGTIDITPEGCKTPEGIARVNKAMRTLEDTTADVANKAVAFMVELLSQVQVPNELANELKELNVAIRLRQAAQEEFFRAVAGAPPQ